MQETENEECFLRTHKVLPERMLTEPTEGTMDNHKQSQASNTLPFPLIDLLLVPREGWSRRANRGRVGARDTKRTEVAPCSITALGGLGSGLTWGEAECSTALKKKVNFFCFLDKTGLLKSEKVSILIPEKLCHLPTISSTYGEWRFNAIC